MTQAGDPRFGAQSPEELVRLARAGSSDAFAELVARFERPLFDFLRFLADSEADAEELCQDAFVRAWSKLHLFDERHAFSGWLFTIGRRLAVSRRRRRALFRVGERGLPSLSSGGDPARILGRREESANLWSIAARVLDEPQRAAVWLRYAEGLDIAQIARILGRREPTVRVHLFRARRTLAKHLERPDERPAFLPMGPPTPASASSACG